MRPMVKPSGTKHLKLKCDILLSTFALKFNLRRYSQVDTIKLLLERGETVDFETTGGATALIAASLEGQVDSMVGRCGAACHDQNPR